MWKSSLWLVILGVVATGDRALCLTVRIGTGGISTYIPSAFNSTSSTPSATGSHGYWGTGTTVASQTRTGAQADTAITAGPSFGSGPCPTNAADYPAFIMPTTNPTESCDIYGPLCQTGSIAVGVRSSNNNATATTTTVPCSCYLTAQSLTVNPTSPPWQTGFGRSNQCLSFYNIQNTPTLANNAPLFSSCPKSEQPGAPGWDPSDLNKTMPNPLPKLLVDAEGGTCCGLCALILPRVKISFFPESQGSSCANGNATGGESAAKSVITPAPSHSLVHRALHRRGNASIAVSNGFTYTSPSIYMEIDSPFSMTDACGTMGRTYPSTILAFAPGSVSTVSYNVPLGADFGTGAAAPSAAAFTKAMSPKDLICPTWGLSGPYNPDTTAMPYLVPGAAGINISPDGKPNEVEAGDGVTVGPPFFPLIVVPTGIVSLDPAWSRCSKILNTYIPIIDPPRTLSVDDAMDGPAAPPPAPPTPTPQLELVPSSSTQQPVPTAAADPGVQTGIVQEQADPTNSEIFDAGLPATTNAPADPPSVTKAPAPEDPNQSPQANIPSAQKESNIAANLNAALAAPNSQAAAPPAPTSSAAVDNNDEGPAPDPQNTQQAVNQPPPVDVVHNPVPPAVTSTPPSSGDSDPQQPPAPAFAEVISQNNNDNNDEDPSNDAGPSSPPGIGAQIFRPFVPKTTAHSTIEVAPIPAGTAGTGPSPGAQTTPNTSNNDNSPQQQEPQNPSNANTPPANAPNPVQNLPNQPHVSVNPGNGPPAAQNNGLLPPSTPPTSNSPPGQASSSPEQPQQPQQEANPPAISINSQAYTRNSASAYFIDSQTLLPGGAAVTINSPGSNKDAGSGTGSGNPTSLAGSAPTPAPVIISLASDGSVAVVGSSTQEIVANGPTASSGPTLLSSQPFGAAIPTTLSPPPAASSPPLPSSQSPIESAFTINNQPFIIQPSGPTVAVTGAGATAGQESGAVTLTAVGQTVTIASTPVALASSAGSVVLVEGTGSGESIVAVASATGNGVGSGVVIEPAPSVSTTGAGAGKSGAAGRKKGMEEGWVWVVMIGVMTLIVGF